MSKKNRTPPGHASAQKEAGHGGTKDGDQHSTGFGADGAVTGASRLAELVRTQESLLRDLGFGVRTPGEANDEYKRQHLELGQLLRADGVPCYCPWGSAHAFPGWAAKQGDVETALSRLLTDDIKRLTGLGPAQPKWTLVPHSRYFRDFVNDLRPDQQKVLDAMLENELRVRGLEMLGDTDKLVPCSCNAGGSVLEYRIQRKTRNTEYKLRVFVETRPGNVFVLLHGFDKAGNDDEGHQNAQIQEACERRG